MIKYLLKDLEELEKKPNKEKVPFIFFIERWDINIVQSLNEAVKKAFGGKGLIQIPDE